MSKLHLAVLDQSFDVTVSPSFLAEAMCPFAVYSKRVLNNARTTSTALEVGRSVHGIFESIMHLRQRNEAIDDAAVDLIYRKHISPMAMPSVGEIRRMTNTYLTNFYVPIDTVAGIEEVVMLDEKGGAVHSWDDAWIGGVLDLVQIKGDVGRVIDYKTQWNILSKDELERHFQLTFYLVLLRKLYPHLRRFEAAIYYNRHGFMHVTERTSEQLNDCELEISLRIDEIRRWENWEPIPGEHCTICDSIGTCPKALDLSPIPDVIATTDQATQAAQRLRAMEVVIKDLKGKLKIYCGENGEVPSGPTFRYGFQASIKTDYPAGPISEKLRTHEIDPAPYLRVDGTAMKRLMRNMARANPDVAADISSVFVEHAKTTFKGYKAGGGDEDEDEGE